MDETGALVTEAVEPGTPMEWAKHYVTLTRRKREIDSQLAVIRKEIDVTQDRILELIENEELPESCKVLGASLYTREELWASARDGDHVRLAAVLKEVGLVEFLPRNVNSQSISAYVREHYDKETGEFDDLIDPRLLEALNVTVKPKAVVNG